MFSCFRLEVIQLVSWVRHCDQQRSVQFVLAPCGSVYTCSDQFYQSFLFFNFLVQCFYTIKVTVMIVFNIVKTVIYYLIRICYSLILLLNHYEMFKYLFPRHFELFRSTCHATGQLPISTQKKVTDADWAFLSFNLQYTETIYKHFGVTSL